MSEIEKGFEEAREAGGLTRHWIISLVSVLVLSVAALAVSWSSYQSDKWSGVNLELLIQAGNRRAVANRMVTEARQAQQVDIALFAQWLNAYARGDSELEVFYRSRFRDEFKPAFEKWLVSKPLKNPGAAPTPFALPEYRPAALEQSERINAEAEKTEAEAGAALDLSDRYTFNTVILSMALFYGGVLHVVRHFSLRMVLLGLAVLMCAFGIINLAVYPKLLDDVRVLHAFEEGAVETAPLHSD